VDFEAIRPALEAIRPRWAKIIYGQDGFFLEDKGWALALHARFARDSVAEGVLAQARRAVDAELLAEQFRMLGGHKFLEVAPRLANKRETVAHLLDQYALPDAHLIYIGDDDKDEEAFSLIHANQGVAIKVWQPSQAGSPTESDLFFESPAETLGWLATLL
jgi:trehalose-phosphatase